MILIVQVVHGLREMAQHYRLPNISWTASFGAEFTLTITLRKADLLRYSNWRSVAKKYIANQDDELGLGVIVAQYHKRIMDFYRWLSDELQAIHAAEFQKLHDMQQAELRRNAPLIINSITANIAALEAGSGTVRDVLHSLLTDLEHRELYVHEREPLTWVENALRLIEPRFPLPAALVARLRSAAASARQPEAG